MSDADPIRDPVMGLWVPEYFASDPKHAHFVLERVGDVDEAAAFCRRKLVAVQAGGFVGVWPLRLMRHFTTVHTYEPDPRNIECLMRNTQHHTGIVVHPEALGAQVGDVVNFEEERDSSCSRVASTGSLLRRTTTIDALFLPVCDLIYLDLEGYEMEALQGAAQTIGEHHPTIVVEAWRDRRKAYREAIEAMGYTLRAMHHKDMVFTAAGILR